MSLSYSCLSYIYRHICQSLISLPLAVYHKISSEVQEQVKKLQAFITDHFYKCSDEVLFSLGKMYAAGGEFTDNIDKMGGDGTAEFTYQAINNYCKG